MRLGHISDHHGSIRETPFDCDIVIASGDMMPNWSYGIHAIEEPRQTQWLKENARRIGDCWTKGKPLVNVLGNHCYVDPSPILRAAGIESYTLMSEMLTIDGLRMFGFPWIPVFHGTWNREIHEYEIEERLKPVAELIESGDIEVLISHAPLWGTLDKNSYGEHCGSKALMDMVYGLKKPLKLLAVGHIHEQNGITTLPSGTVYSNAATTSRLIIL